jgi:hypothetical protein
MHRECAQGGSSQHQPDIDRLASDPTSAEWLAIYRYWADMNEEA